jgi:hypothetical protein
MSLGTNSNSRFPTAAQNPDHAILDTFNKQAYLGNQFVANSGLVTLGDTAEHTVLYLANPAGTTKSLFNSVRKLFAGDITNYIIFKIYSNPTVISGGTPATPFNCRPASANTSISTVLISPSDSTNGTLIATFPVSLGYSPSDSESCLILDPGQSLLVTAKGSAATSCVAEFVWWEI